MGNDTEERLTFRMEGLSVDEIDEIVVFFHTHSERVHEDTHRDAALLHTVQVFVHQHGDALKTGATLATALIGWLREWRKRVAAEKTAAVAARRPEIELVRADGVSLRLRDATDDDVRAHLRHIGMTR